MIELLSAVTVTESQCAYSCLTNELSKMWLFIMRTTMGVGHLSAHLEDAINNSFPPALLGPNIPNSCTKSLLYQHVMEAWDGKSQQLKLRKNFITPVSTARFGSGTSSV